MVHSLADIVGASASAASISPASNISAQWVQFIVTGSGTVRLGDSNTSSTRGAPIPAGGSQFFPYKGTSNFYPLAGIYAYIPTGATLSVLYDA